MGWDGESASFEHLILLPRSLESNHQIPRLLWIHLRLRVGYDAGRDMNWELPRRLECWRTIADLARLSPRHLRMFSCTLHVFAMETSTVLYEHRGSEALEKQT